MELRGRERKGAYLGWCGTERGLRGELRMESGGSAVS